MPVSQKVKDAKAAFRTAKQEFAAAKKVVAEAQRQLVDAEEPADITEAGKTYRAAVGEHIKTRKAALKAQTKLDKLLETDAE